MSTDSKEQLLYAAGPGGAERIDFHPSFRTASNALNSVAPGVYEGLRTFEGRKFFGLRSHIERLRDSVARYRRPLEFDEERFVKALETAAPDATAAFDSEARVRIDVTAEPARLLGSDANILLAVTPFRGLPKEVVEHGAFLATAPGLARPDPAVKTSDFIPLREAWIAAHGAEDAYEHVMLGEGGELLEGTQSNVVFVRRGALYAAPHGVLPGVTQRAALDLARDAGMDVRLEFTTIGDLDEVDEIFMTTSVRSIVPVSRLDDARFPNKGPVTARISELYDALTAKEAVLPSERASAIA